MRFERRTSCVIITPHLSRFDSCGLGMLGSTVPRIVLPYVPQLLNHPPMFVLLEPVRSHTDSLVVGEPLSLFQSLSLSLSLSLTRDFVALQSLLYSSAVLYIHK
jgi:hypothetical protein